jgi:hypothetical protein
MGSRGCWALQGSFEKPEWFLVDHSRGRFLFAGAVHSFEAAALDQSKVLHNPPAAEGDELGLAAAGIVAPSRPANEEQESSPMAWRRSVLPWRLPNRGFRDAQLPAGLRDGPADKSLGTGVQAAPSEEVWVGDIYADTDACVKVGT